MMTDGSETKITTEGAQSARVLQFMYLCPNRDSKRQCAWLNDEFENYLEQSVYWLTSNNTSDEDINKAIGCIQWTSAG